MVAIKAEKHNSCGEKVWRKPCMAQQRESHTWLSQAAAAAAGAFVFLWSHDILASIGSNVASHSVQLQLVQLGNGCFPFEAGTSTGFIWPFWIWYTGS